MVQRLKDQLSDGGKWAREQAKNNPLGLLVIFVFAVWLIASLWITHRANRWGFDGKTFWEWMELLIVPIVLALGALWFNASQKKTELRIAEEARKTERAIAEKGQRQATLDAYYKQMADLLLNHGLRKSRDKDEVRSIAKVTTLSILWSLDTERKGQVVKFLHESRLIDKENTVVDLNGANLKEVKLEGTKLYGASLVGADLSGTKLSGANLFEADLREANLEGADLGGAYLEGADLREANLEGTDLGGAYLEGADLREIKNWTYEQLRHAISLENATMPDGSMYEEWIEKHKDQQPQ